MLQRLQHKGNPSIRGQYTSKTQFRANVRFVRQLSNAAFHTDLLVGAFHHVWRHLLNRSEFVIEIDDKSLASSWIHDRDALGRQIRECVVYLTSWQPMLEDCRDGEIIRRNLKLEMNDHGKSG